jgi:hypothetical protein
MSTRLPPLGDRPLAVPAGADEAWQAIVPTWRRDLAIEADLAEEVARLGGYDQIPTRLPDTEMPAWRPDPLETRAAVRATLVGAGLAEVVTHALGTPSRLAHQPDSWRWQRLIIIFDQDRCPRPAQAGISGVGER